MPRRSTTCGRTGRTKDEVDLVERYCKEQGLFRTDATPAADLHQDRLARPGDGRAVARRAEAPARPRAARRDERRRGTRPSERPVTERGFGLDDAALGARRRPSRTTATRPRSATARSSSPRSRAAPTPAIRRSCSPPACWRRRPSSKGLHGAAVREDQPRPRLARRHRLSRQGRPRRSRSTSSASTPSATAARPASATAARCPSRSPHAVTEGQPRRVGRHLRQSQFRRPRQSAREGELPGQPAARRGLCPRRHDRHRPDDRADRHRQRTAKQVYLKDIWPTQRGSASRRSAKSVLPADVRSRAMPTSSPPTRPGTRSRSPRATSISGIATSTYIQEPPFLADMTVEAGSIQPIAGARVLAVLGDSVTTDHISPAGNISKNSPAGKYLMEHGVQPRRLQQLRQPPRQRPRHGPRHVRQHPHPQFPRPRHRRRRDEVSGRALAGHGVPATKPRRSCRADGGRCRRAARCRASRPRRRPIGNVRSTTPR